MPSHELKTPLAGIRLMTDSILQTEDHAPEMTREFVTDIEREADRLSRITEDLLRLTRLDSGHVDKAYPVAVAPVLGRVLRMLKLVARERQIPADVRGRRAGGGARDGGRHPSGAL